ncbi:MAG: penicillin-binding protein [Demequina sp.]|nr:penicillin-binding protein [Demequina sp.]
MNDQPKAPQRVSTRPAATAKQASNPVRTSVRPAPKPATPSGSFTTGGGGKKPPTKNGKKQPEGPRWKRVTKRVGLGVLIAGCAAVILGFLGLAFQYSRLSVPEPADFAKAQSSTIYYADGKTLMGRLGVADRKIVDISTLPEYVPQAFVASEDKTFYTNHGIDFMGTARALFKTVVLGHKQGGSTITQQYVERYYVGETTTSIKGKINEALLAYKIDNQQEKNEVLGNYMNTIYFGRGAYGIEAAARQYFGESAAQLTVDQVAMLVGIVPAPSAWDPRLDPERAEVRWNYVLDSMLQEGYITQAQRTAAVFPETIEYKNKDTYAGTQGYLLTTALAEVAEETGITQDQIESMGYTVITTINKKDQVATVKAVSKIPKGHSPNLQVGAVTLDPKTGAILSMYGGHDYLERQRNAVTQDIAQAGSTFKPFALIAALENDISLKSTYSGKNLMTIPGFERKVRNFNNESFSKISLADATAYSVNTVYAQVGQQVGPDAVMETAIKAGLPEDTAGLTDNAANVLGTASPHVLDMARAYATIANNGVRTEPYIVSEVIDADGKTIYKHEVESTPVFASDVMADTTYAMTQVVQKGSGTYVKELGRPIAGKTGTSNDNKSAWFVGFTPSVVGAVALYQVGEDGSAENITKFGGFDQITGGTIPARVFTWMMAPILKGTDIEKFPPRANIGVAASPTPTPKVTETPKPTKTSEPVVTPSVTPTPDPVPTDVPTVAPTP